MAGYVWISHFKEGDIYNYGAFAIKSNYIKVSFSIICPPHYELEAISDILHRTQYHCPVTKAEKGLSYFCTENFVTKRLALYLPAQPPSSKHPHSSPAPTLQVSDS